MPLFVPIIVLFWLLLVAGALLLCVAARRTDAEMTREESAPVIELDAAALTRHRHSAA